MSQLFTFVIITSFCLCFTSCSTKAHEKSSAKNSVVSQFEKPILTRVKSHGITFKASLEPIVKNSLRPRIVNGTIYNSTAKPVYYLSSSCNGLDYYLKFSQETAQATPLIQCNASYPLIGVIHSKDSLAFDTYIHKDSGEVQVGIDFRQINMMIPRQKLIDSPALVNKIYNATTNPDDILWSIELID